MVSLRGAFAAFMMPPARNCHDSAPRRTPPVTAFEGSPSAGAAARRRQRGCPLAGRWLSRRRSKAAPKAAEGRQRGGAAPGPWDNIPSWESEADVKRPAYQLATSGHRNITPDGVPRDRGDTPVAGASPREARRDSRGRGGARPEARGARHLRQGWRVGWRLPGGRRPGHGRGGARLEVRGAQLLRHKAGALAGASLAGGGRPWTGPRRRLARGQGPWAPVPWLPKGDPIDPACCSAGRRLSAVLYAAPGCP